MSQRPISPLLRAWYKWKTLRLPWRRQFLVGLDLHGNTYWEFLDRGSRLPSPNPTHPNLTPVRWRRIVRYPSGTHHSAVAVPPAWHQWLRHTRADPPSLGEQRAEVARQARMRQLAAEADARWEAKPKVMEAPAAAGSSSAVFGVREPAFETERTVGPGSKVLQGKPAGVKVKTEVWGVSEVGADEAGSASHQAVGQREETWKQMKLEEEAKGNQRFEGKERDPWKQAKGGPSETWQPQAWQPTPKPKQ